MSKPFRVTCPNCQHCFSFKRVSLAHRAKVADRFWSKVYCDPNTGCFLWYGALDGSGRYGEFRIASDDPYLDSKVVRAHRYSFEMANGPIPTGCVVMHKCDTPRCVNSEHLELGTQLENMNDCARKGRNARRLTPAIVIRAKELWASGYSRKRICDALGVTSGALQALIEGRTWKHVGLPDGGSHARARLICRGEASGKSRTTEDTVRAIRAAHADGTPLSEIVARFGMSRSQTWKIIRRDAWGHI